MTKKELSTIAVKKAKQSNCYYKISAIGLNKRGEIIVSAFNKHRFMRPSGGIHAEMEVMLKGGPSVKTILICRVGRGGNILPIDPCPICKAKADELGIKIISIES